MSPVRRTCSLLCEYFIKMHLCCLKRCEVHTFRFCCSFYFPCVIMTNQNGDNVLIPPQIQKDFFWGICRYGSCAHFGNAVGRRVLTIKAHLSRWMGPRFKVHQRTSLIRFLWFGLWLIKRNMWSAFPSSPFHPQPPVPPSPSALAHIWRHHTLSLTVIFASSLWEGGVGGGGWARQRKGRVTGPWPAELLWK